MVKTIKVKIDKDVVVPAETVSEPVAETSPKKEGFEYPVIGTTGKFHAVAFEGGYVVYNPAGQRATGVIAKVQADDLVRKNNQAAHIKG